MSEYPLKPLGDICEINPDALTETSDPTIRYRYIDLSSIKEQKADLSTAPLPFADLPSRARRRVALNDVLLGTVRPNLKNFAIIESKDDDLLCSTGFAVLRSKATTSDSRFVFHAINSEIVARQLNSLVTGSNYPAVNATQVAELLIPVPPLPGQKKIAEILSGVDMAIKTMHSAIIKIDNTIQGARDQTQACEGDHVRIGELIAKISTGVSVNGENRPCKASEHGILKVSCVSKGVFYPSENKVIQGEHKDRATMSVKKGMLLMSRANTPELVGACAFVTNDHDNLFLPDKIWNLEISQYAPCSKRWLNNALNSCIARSRLRDASTGTSNSMRNISQNNFCEIELLIPTPETQQAQADAIDSLQKKRMAFAGKLSKYLMIKSALSDDLLSGRKRVPV